MLVSLQEESKLQNVNTHSSDKRVANLHLEAAGETGKMLAESRLF